MLLILLSKLFYIHYVKSSQQFYNVEIIIPDLQMRKTEAYKGLTGAQELRTIPLNFHTHDLTQGDHFITVESWTCCLGSWGLGSPLCFGCGQLACRKELLFTDCFDYTSLGRPWFQILAVSESCLDSIGFQFFFRPLGIHSKFSFLL